VLHAGFYYASDSLKARFTRDGNMAWQEFCRERRLPLNCCGKLVVARRPTEIDGLRELKRRGERNGITLEWIDSKAARDIEPRVKTCEFALWSPTTASVDPVSIVQTMAQEARAAGVSIVSDVAVHGWSKGRVLTNRDPIDAGFVVNSAGLYADKVARWFGFSQHYRILPFKGLYLYSDETPGALRTNIYPVPDLRNPFLGVHFTVAVDGRCKIGPTAIPALWRENYKGLSKLRIDELADVIWRELRLFFASDFDFKRLAFEELRKYSRRRMLQLAGELAAGMDISRFHRWGTPGIRAQLLDTRSNRLEMDFVIEGDDRSMHVLNAVSPAFTCALPFAAHVCEEIERRSGTRTGNAIAAPHDATAE
jgi:(S)-2-hydroxyglutarate dehydrogenase